MIALLDEVNKSRYRVREQRSISLAGGGHAELARSYDALADAMEAYADEARVAGVPLPYRFRTRLHLYRSLGATKT